MQKRGAGKLRWMITVEQLVDTNVAGKQQQAPSTFCIRPASVTPLTGRELANAKGVESDVTHLVELRYDSGAALITPKMRINYQGRILNIKAVRDVEERHRWLELDCVEQTT